MYGPEETRNPAVAVVMPLGHTERSGWLGGIRRRYLPEFRRRVPDLIA
jgi:hypothetical protein